jgi:putative spermidine/putrescine transport system permease protein
MSSRRSPYLSLTAILVYAFLYLPIIILVVFAFNSSRQNIQFEGVVNRAPCGPFYWFCQLFDNQDAMDATWNTLRIATVSTLFATVIGTMAALALQRFAFFGRNVVSLLIILPIALPGIVTGIALNNGFRTILGWDLGFLTIVVAHATFCIVTVFNNVQARLRRLGGNLEEASADLGAGTFTTFRLVTFPMLRSSLLAGGLLAFGLSFDEIIVTTFTAGVDQQTLPIWIFQNMFRPNQAPVVNVVAAALVVLSVIPIWLAQRLSGSGEAMTTAR